MIPQHDIPAQLANLADRKRSKRKLVALTAYDYPSARLLDEAGVDVILVGDSLGMVVLGYEDTTFVTLEEMEHHTRACRRGVSQALLVGDLPFQTYESPEQAVASARRLVKAGAEMVKLEGGSEKAGEVAAIVAEGIPVMGHIGMLPQQVREEGGYKKKGKTSADAERLLEDAAALVQAGVSAMVLESMVAGVSVEITRNVPVPTIGIGAGEGCDGQILVLHDLIGGFPWFRPVLAMQHGDVAGVITRAVNAYAKVVRGE
ncbi:MAG: 3-methyl-2-oxobutanoate hydroxymethyltransferase [Verrucomicrobia bacterium]|nr:3-methyl-2-oxobutanoate hydroxymethyltransferase [Verrucomicrobiota bacterium]